MNNLERIRELHHQIADLIIEAKRLQEQLNEANEVIKEYAKKSSWMPTEKRRDLWAFPEEGYLLAKNYLEEWGVK